MNETLFQQNYVYAADMVALILCIIVNVLCHSTYAIKKRNITIFRRGNRLVGVAAACSMSYHWLATYIRPEWVPLIYIYRIVTYFCLVAVYVCFFIYIKNLVDMKPLYERIMKIVVYGGCVVHTVAQVLSPFIKTGFYIDENLQIHQSYYTDIFRYVYVYLSINFLVLMIVYRKKFIGKMFWCICMIMGISYAVMLYQAIDKSTTYSVISFAFPILAVLFLFHYNSYDVETGTLDQYSFRQYVEEMKGKSILWFSFLCLEYLRIDYGNFQKIFCVKTIAFLKIHVVSV